MLFFYGATDKNDWGIMLAELENIGTTVTGPWLVMGDFNCIANLNERVGKNYVFMKLNLFEVAWRATTSMT